MAADTPKIVLTPQERSHYFNRRECVANEPLKVGRSVDRRRISPNNLIFDCRVLSRNHAQIWFEDGKFYIKDTKSSNGTFVNDNRLSPSGEESGQVELKSRDVVQFGVNVNVDKKVTHGCIIATVKLFLNEVEIPGHEPPVQQVMQILMSALSREQELETKLASMQSVLSIAKELATDSMIAIVKEDELMSRLEMLENQLQVYSRNASDDELKKQLAKAFEEKHKNELASKDSLRGVLQEKLECVSKLSQLQRDYDKAEQDCQRYKALLEDDKEEHSQEVTELGVKLKSSETERKEIETKLSEEKKNLATSLESLQADAEFTTSQFEKAKERLSETETELLELKISMETARQREAKGMLSAATEIPPGTEDPPGIGDPVDIERSLVPPGTEDPAGEPAGSTPKAVTTDNEVQPVSERVGMEVVAMQGAAMQGAAKQGSMLAQERVLPSPLDRRDTVMPSSWDQLLQITDSPTEMDTLRVRMVSLESELRTSQERVKLLEVEVSSGVVAAADSPFTRDMVKLAKKLSDSAITRGQLEVLQQSLLEAENMIVELRAQKASSSDLTPPDSRTSHYDSELEAQESARLREDVRGLQNSSIILESRLQASEEESRLYCEKKNSLEIELSVVSARFTSQSQDNFVLKQKNEDLSARNEDMRRRIDELCSTLKTYEQPSGIKKHVKLLTFIALVSIGVALASWLL